MESMNQNEIKENQNPTELFDDFLSNNENQTFQLGNGETSYEFDSNSVTITRTESGKTKATMTLNKIGEDFFATQYEGDSEKFNGKLSSEQLTNFIETTQNEINALNGKLNHESYLQGIIKNNKKMEEDSQKATKELEDKLSKLD